MISTFYIRKQTKWVLELPEETCAYYTLHQQNLANNCETDNRPAALTLPLIERLMKAFKTHRAAVDFDAGFVNSVVSAAIENDAVAKN